ncbi:aminomethyl-transferring glycine dehydrogenase [Membranihabitans marinus]
MLKTIGMDSTDAMVRQIIPAEIQLSHFDLDLPAMTEAEYLSHIQTKAMKNKVFRSLIGQGYYNTHTPSAIRRNILENPGWYTQYTPYQAEISQGRLEALFNFQTVVSDLTGFPIANASLLDEGTAAAEAVSMLMASVNKKNKKNPKSICFIQDTVFAQTRSVILSRTKPLGYSIQLFGDISEVDVETAGVVVIQYPDSRGNIAHIKDKYSALSDAGIGLIAICDLLALTLLESPGHLGFDVAVGTTQRFGVPIGFGGPHAGYFACLDKYKRVIPGRIIGLSKDVHGNPAYRMALQTREQHIKREKATSNICTAQALLAIMAGMYAVYHGPKNLRRIALRTHLLTHSLYQALAAGGIEVAETVFFDTIVLPMSPEDQGEIRKLALEAGFNFHYTNEGIQISLDELSTESEVLAILKIFGVTVTELSYTGKLEDTYLRTDAILSHPVFNQYRSETNLMRYIKSLENKDLSLVHSMIPLGSCTMKLNAASELIPITWTEFSTLHPFVPQNQSLGYREIIEDLGQYLAKITGFHACSFQPNSGAQGEFTGLLVIRAYHEDHGGADRRLIVIPASAHGTNPASAVLAGYDVAIVRSDEDGNIDLKDLEDIINRHGSEIAGFMVTYPSTHGVFESTVKQACDMIHAIGGLVYMDGANMNAQIGYTSPGFIGADVCHLNLHKTFAIPHGGGGPGVGPICVTEALSDYLPGHPYLEANEGQKSIDAVASAPYGSASILLISYAYVRMLGARGLKNATKYAILNANYLKTVLSSHYDILYTGSGDFVGHELILDLRKFKEVGISAEDVAKRLIDFGFHAPTLSFPVAGTLMIEPTESEDKVELDRFIAAMVAIRAEIDEVALGEYPKDDNVLVNAPHPIFIATMDDWPYPYSRQKALYPLDSLREGHKFYIQVGRIDNAYGDRNLICTCPPIEDYITQT